MSRQRWAWALVAAVVGAQGAVGWTVAAAPPAGNIAEGKKIFMESCQHCHGALGDGKSEMAGYLTPPPSNLTAPATQAKPDAELKKTILQGRPGTAMTGFDGALNDGQLADIVAYIRTLKP